MSKEEYNKALSTVSFGTINRIFEIENFKINDMVESGARYILARLPNICHLGGNHFGDRHTCECLIKMCIEFVSLQPVFDYEEIDENWVKIKLLSHEVNPISTKVLYLKINKSYLQK